MISFDIVTHTIAVNLTTVMTRDVAFYSDQKTGDGATLIFSTTHQFKSNSVLVFLNGVLAKKGEGFTYVEGSDQQSIEFASAPEGGTHADDILIHYAIL